MIAYYALLAFVPLTFLAVSLLGLFGRADESTYLVRELSRMFPQSEVSTIVRAVNEIQDLVDGRSGSSASGCCSGRRSASSARSSPHSTSSTDGRTGRSSVARRWPPGS